MRRRLRQESAFPGDDGCLGLSRHWKDPGKQLAKRTETNEIFLFRSSHVRNARRQSILPQLYTIGNRFGPVLAALAAYTAARRTACLLPPRTSNALYSCKICTIRLEELCYQRAWWFRASEPAAGTPLAVLMPIQE